MAAAWMSMLVCWNDVVHCCSGLFGVRFVNTICFDLQMDDGRHPHHSIQQWSGGLGAQGIQENYSISHSLFNHKHGVCIAGYTDWPNGAKSLVDAGVSPEAAF